MKDAFSDPASLDTQEQSAPDSGNTEIAVVIQSESQLDLAFNHAYRLASIRHEKLKVLLVTEQSARPEWFVIPDALDESSFTLFFLDQQVVADEIEHWLQDNNPDLLIIAFDPLETGNRYTLGKDLDVVLAHAKSPVGLYYVPEGGEMVPVDESMRTLVPFSGDENSMFAIKTALNINPIAELTVVATGPSPLDEADRIAQKEIFKQQLGEYADHPRVTPRLLMGENAVKRLLKGADSFDIILLGASRGNTLTRAMLGDAIGIDVGPAGQQLVRQTDLPYIIVREYQGWLGSRLALAVSRSGELLPTVTQQERVSIYKEVRRAARPQIDFFVMTALSAAIAAFGLILDSTAVIIGAMLIAPLMSAIIGMGLAMVQGDTRFLGSTAGAAGKGALVAVLVGILVGMLDMDRAATVEMLRRSGPNLFDLAVATLSGAAAAYALCRRGVSTALSGVAIAVALVPPLASLGLFIAYSDWALAYGALLLFITNLVAIAFSSGIIFTMVGFRPAQVRGFSLARLLAFKRSFFVMGLIILAVISNLTLLSMQKSTEENRVTDIREVITSYLRSDIERDIFLTDLTVTENDAGYADVLVTVSSSKPIGALDVAALAERLASTSKTPIRLSVIFTPLMRSALPAGFE